MNMTSPRISRRSKRLNRHPVARPISIHTRGLISSTRIPIRRTLPSRYNRRSQRNMKRRRHGTMRTLTLRPLILRRRYRRRPRARLRRRHTSHRRRQPSRSERRIKPRAQVNRSHHMIIRTRPSQPPQNRRLTFILPINTIKIRNVNNM